MIHAIRFGLGTFESPPSGVPFSSVGLLGRLLRPFPGAGIERSLKKPSGGVSDVEDIMVPGARHLYYSNTNKSAQVIGFNAFVDSASFTLI